MFVVKHYQRNGLVAVCGCDSYEYQAESPLRMDLFHKVHGASVIDIADGDSVFVENLAGKTVTAIRPPRE